MSSSNPGRGGTRGSIVTLGSGNSFAAAPHMVQYTTAKHAILGLTKNSGKFLFCEAYMGAETLWASSALAHLHY